MLPKRPGVNVNGDIEKKDSGRDDYSPSSANNLHGGNVMILI
jgi:hypothetical protein